MLTAPPHYLIPTPPSRLVRTCHSLRQCGSPCRLRPAQAMTETVLPPPPPYSLPNASEASETLEPLAPRSGRLSNGRFTYGNPGKPRGARHRTSREVEQLLEGAAEEVVQYVIGAARCGSLEAQKWILDRCAPARKGRAVVLDDFPE